MREYSVRQIIEATKGKLLCGDENALVKDVVIDSRKAHPEALFVPIIGEKMMPINFYLLLQRQVVRSV